LRIGTAAAVRDGLAGRSGPRTTHDRDPRPEPARRVLEQAAHHRLAPARLPRGRRVPLPDRPVPLGRVATTITGVATPAAPAGDPGPTGPPAGGGASRRGPRDPARGAAAGSRARGRPGGSGGARSPRRT